MHPPKLIVLPLVLGVLVPAACGDGGDPGPPLSAEEFVERANAICVQGDRELEEAGEDVFDGDQATTGALAAFFLDEAIPIARRKLDQIEDLEPPAAEADTVEEMVAAGRTAIAKVEDDLEDDPVGYLTEGGPDPFDAFNEMARGLGLVRCASVVEQPPGDGDDPTTTTTTSAPPAAPTTETSS